MATPQSWWLRVDSNHQPSAYETLALYRLSYTADLEARGGVEPRVRVRPALRFRRPTPGTRAIVGRGVRPTRLCKLHAPKQSAFCRDESRPDKLEWWSELESNQPFGNFRPALIHLSYPTLNGALLTPGGTERTRTVIGLVDNQVPHLSATVPFKLGGLKRLELSRAAVTVRCSII